MSIFYRAFTKLGRDVPLMEVKYRMVEPLIRRPEDLVPVVHDFSLLIFTYLGFSMSKEDVLAAWRPIEAKIRVERLNEILRKEPKKRLIESFDYVELMSLQGCIFARQDQKTKVLQDHMRKAYKLIKCPFPLEGWCD
jgi:hypothetical protein